MNLIYAGLTLVAVALPGFIFWYAYRLDERRSSGYSRPLISTWIPCLITTVLLHSLWFPVADSVSRLCLDKRIDYTTVAAILVGSADRILKAYGGNEDEQGSADEKISGQTENVGFENLYAVLDRDFTPILCWLGCLYAASFALGLVIFFFVRSLRWRIFSYVPILAFNHWYSLLRLSLLDRKPKVANRSDVFIAAMVETATANYLYAGYLHRYLVDGEGKLRSVTLFDAARRIIPSDANESTKEPRPAPPNQRDKNFYFIDGDFFVVRVDDVKNLLVKFIYWEKQNKDPPLWIRYTSACVGLLKWMWRSLFRNNNPQSQIRGSDQRPARAQKMGAGARD